MTAAAQSQQGPPLSSDEAMLERVLEALLSADALTPQDPERGRRAAALSGARIDRALIGRFRGRLVSRRRLHLSITEL